MAGNTLVLSDSLSLYNFMCQRIVGTEETVRTKRLMNSVRDNLCSNEIDICITSGSVGEGLELKGSDIDLMFVSTLCVVHENTDNVKFYPAKVNLVMEMDETKPGYTLLRVFSVLGDAIFTVCEYYDKSWYFSSELYKTSMLKASQCSQQPQRLNKIHGPCLSDMDANCDFAYCVQNPNWPQTAENWINRGSKSWPSSDVKSDVIEHGVLLVPIGSKGSDKEALEWRISFSVAEKLLIYSFSHTQLLCYALMKILLKDLISINSNCKDLLCSYFIKTIVFWVSEETSVTEWKPENCIQCFMRCFRRLLYCVEYSMCPHFFIPTINMFENKIEGRSRQLLLEHLEKIFSLGWRCVFLSKQFQSCPIHSSIILCTTEITKTQFYHLLVSESIDNMYPMLNSQLYGRCIRQLNITKSSYIKSICLWFMSSVCAKVVNSTASASNINKKLYYQYRENQSNVLQSVHHDAVSGWLLLVVLFYRMKEYSKALYLLNYTLKKCTPEKTYNENCLSKLLNLETPITLQKHEILRIFKHRIMHPVIFDFESQMIPEELALDIMQHPCVMPPVVFTHFMCFLCHYHLNDIQQCYNSIYLLKQTIAASVCIKGSEDKGQSFNLLGIALQLVEQNDLAAEAFIVATQYNTDYNSGATRLMMMMNM